MAPGAYVAAAGLGLFAFFQWRRGFGQNPAALFVAFAASVLFLARSGRQLPVDAGLYYLSAMNWIAHAPAPLGLANLEARLGLDSAWLLFESALRAKRALGWTHLVVAEIALRSLALGWIARNFLAQWAKGESRNAIFHLIGFAVLLSYLAIRAPSPTTTDLSANLLAFCAWMAFGRLLLMDDADWRTAGGNAFALLILMVVLAATFKLAVLPVGLLPLALPALRRDWRSLLAGQYRVLGAVLLYGALWLVRNFMLSGCFAFPAAATCIAVPWDVGTDAHSLALVIRGWARRPGAGSMDYLSLFDMRWISSWLPGFARSVELWLVVVALLLALPFSIFKPHGKRAAFAGLAPLVGGSLFTVLAGLLLWFFAAPNPRFSWCFFAILAAMIVFRAAWDRSLPKAVFTMTARQAFLGVVLLGCAPGAVAIARGVGRIDAPVSAAGTVASGQNWPIYVPAAGDQCWDLFPCTPYGFGGKTVQIWNGRLFFRRLVLRS